MDAIPNSLSIAAIVMARFRTDLRPQSFIECPVLVSLSYDLGQIGCLPEPLVGIVRLYLI